MKLSIIEKGNWEWRHSIYYLSILINIYILLNYLNVWHLHHCIEFFPLQIRLDIHN
jgi:hypothetical protein